MSWTPTVETCTFVSASNVFDGLPLAWDLFANSDPDCTWGDNNRSMVTPDVIIDALAGIMDGNMDPADDEEGEEISLETQQVRQVASRLRALAQTYIDLEN